MIGFSVPELLAFAVIPVLYRAVVTGDTAVDLGLSAAVRADGLLSGKISVIGADGIGGGQCIIGQLIVFGNFAHQSRRRLPIGQLFAEEGVEYRTAGIKRLELVLYIKCGEHIFGVAYRQMAGIGIVGCCPLMRRDDVREMYLVMFGKPVRGRLGRGRLQIVKISVLLL